MNFVRLYIGDYMRDTGTLTVAEHGAYMLMLMHYYATEKPIPSGRALHRLLRAETKAEREAIDNIAGRFWTATDGGLVNARADLEITRAERQRDVNRTVGKLGGRPKRTETESVSELETESVSESEPNVNRTQTLTINHKEIEEKATSDEVAGARPSDDHAPQAAALKLVQAEKSRSSPPDCPHQAVLAVWAETLPSMPQHSAAHWRGSRADHLRARWRETAVEKGWTTQQQGLDYLRRLFAFVGASPFLTGREHGRDRRPFFVELAWLVEPTNWAKVIEGKYHATREDATA